MESQLDLQTPEEVFRTAGLVETRQSWLDITKDNLRTIAALGSTVIAASGWLFWEHIETSGKWTLLPATEQTAVPIDSTDTIIDWNMHGQVRTRIKQIRRLAEEYNADQITLQEVDTLDKTTLHKHFPTWNVVYVLADTGQHLLQDGYGNVIMTRQDPTEITARSFPGTSLLQSIARMAKGALIDTSNLLTSTADATMQTVANGKETTPINTYFQELKDGRQEKRAAVAINNQVLIHGIPTNLRVIDGHISGNPSVRKRQLDEFVNFINDNNKPSQPTFVCADFNSPYREVATALAKVNFSVAPKTGQFSSFNDDYCAYSSTNGPIAKVTVLDSPATDHFPLVATLRFPSAPLQPKTIAGR